MFDSIVASGAGSRTDDVVAVLRRSDDRVAHDVRRRDGDGEHAAADLIGSVLEHEDAERSCRDVDRRRDWRAAVGVAPLRSAHPTGFW